MVERMLQLLRFVYFINVIARENTIEYTIFGVRKKKLWQLLFILTCMAYLGVHAQKTIA